MNLVTVALAVLLALVLGVFVGYLTGRRQAHQRLVERFDELEQLLHVQNNEARIESGQQYQELKSSVEAVHVQVSQLQQIAEQIRDTSLPAPGEMELTQKTDSVSSNYFEQDDADGAFVAYQQTLVAGQEFDVAPSWEENVDQETAEQLNTETDRSQDFLSNYQSWNR